MSWHIDEATLAALRVGRDDDARSRPRPRRTSRRARDCRARLTPAVDAGRLDAIWAEVETG